MDKETWLTANEAKELGFVDSIVTHSKAVAKINHKSISKMESGESEFSKLFAELNNVMTEIRLKSEK